LDNKLVRKALSHAINREAILNAVYYNSAEIAKNPIPPDMWSYHEGIEDYEYNPLLAKNLLYKAGYGNGFEIDIWAFPEQRNYNPNSIKTAELIQQDLKKIGVTAKIISYEVGTFLQKVKAGEHYTALQGWIADNGDPDNFFGSLLSCEAMIPGQNSAFWCHEEFDAIIRDAKRITERKQRIQLYRKAQEIVKEEAPWLTLAHTRQNIIINKRVKNLKLSLTGGIFFSGVALEPLIDDEVTP
jgi:dipeptide transport system substrate-binding protein